MYWRHSACLGFGASGAWRRDESGVATEGTRYGAVIAGSRCRLRVVIDPVPVAAASHISRGPDVLQSRVQDLRQLRWAQYRILMIAPTHRLMKRQLARGKCRETVETRWTGGIA